MSIYFSRTPHREFLGSNLRQYHQGPEGIKSYKDHIEWKNMPMNYANIPLTCGQMSM